MTKQEYATWDEPFVEHLRNAASSGGIEIEDDVPTKDDITSSDKMRALLVEQVHLREMVESTHRWRDAVEHRARARGIVAGRSSKARGS